MQVSQAIIAVLRSLLFLIESTAIDRLIRRKTIFVTSASMNLKWNFMKSFLAVKLNETRKKFRMDRIQYNIEQFDF